MEISILSDEDKKKLFQMSQKAKENIEGIIKEEIISTYDVSARNEQEDVER